MDEVNIGEVYIGRVSGRHKMIICTGTDNNGNATYLYFTDETTMGFWVLTSYGLSHHTIMGEPCSLK